MDGITQPAPAPRFSNTPAAPCQPVGEAAGDTRKLLAELGCDEQEITALLSGVAQQAGA